MATWPAKTNYATGDVLSATNMNDIGNGLNDLYGESFTNNFYAGKNKIINGDFGIWQRGTSSAANGMNTADRWFCVVGGTTTFAQDTSVPSGVLNEYSLKWTTGASSSYGQLFQALESAVVKPMRGQSMVFSIYIKSTGTAFAGNYKITAYYSNASDAYASQTTAVTVTGGQSISPTSTWTRYSGTLTIPSDAVGIKIGVVPDTVQSSGVVVYHAAAQLEIGSTATPFQTATGTKQGELAACQRYYYRVTDSSTGSNLMALGTAISTTAVFMPLAIKSTLRANPTSVDYSNIRVHDGATGTNVTAVDLFYPESNYPTLRATVSSGLTQYRPYMFYSQSGSAGYIGINAEL